jgi:DNA polymerase type B, organellar and viral
MRYTHFLRGVKRVVYPSAIVAVAVDSTRSPDGTVEPRERDTLTRVRYAGARVERGRGENRFAGTHQSSAAFWGAVRRRLRDGERVMAVSQGVSRVWGLLGLWEMLENGALVIPGTERAAAGGSPEKEKKGVKPFYVVQDPPTILAIRMPGCPGTLTVCDIRNWGMGRPDPVDPDHDSVLEMLGSMLEMLSLVTDRDWGSLCPTAGSQALHTFRRKYLDTPILCHTDPLASRLESAAYYGGRCEAFRLGSIPGQSLHYDFRSLYPSICSRWDLPARLVATGHGEPQGSIDGKLFVVPYIAEVTLNTTLPRYPLRRGGLTIYPTGRFSTVLAGPELSYALKHDDVTSWGSWARYDMEPSMKRYADDVWLELCRARADGNKPLEAWLKMLGVSLPGKMGQRGSSWEDYPDGLPPAPWSEWVEVAADGEVVRCRSVGWSSQKEVKSEWSDESVPAIAAWITSAGRVKLDNAIETAGREHVYYCDTDSVICDRVGAEGLVRAMLIRDGEMGFMREVECGVDLVIHGIKHYELDGSIRHAGAPRGTIEHGPDRTHYWYRDWLARATTSGRRPDVVRMLRKHASDQTYRHGRVLSDGGVLPFHITEG